MFNIKQENNDVIISDIKNFSLAQTLECGQAFRWNATDENTYEGIALGQFLKISQKGDTVIFHDTCLQIFNTVWRGYFDLDRNYGDIINSLQYNQTLSAAAAFGGGIRILKQDPWEALCSFIISQNNNIPRIKGIVERLCEGFGEKTEGGYTFPSANTISNHTIDDLAVLRSGFRAKYILDAAKKVASSELDLENISRLNTDSARTELMKIYGVGAKVADCTMLYGMGKLDAFPKDVWIKRALEVLFGGDLPESTGEYAGIIQQYIFFYARETKLDIK